MVRYYEIQQRMMFSVELLNDPLRINRVLFAEL